MGLSLKLQAIPGGIRLSRVRGGKTVLFITLPLLGFGAGWSAVEVFLNQNVTLQALGLLFGSFEVGRAERPTFGNESTAVADASRARVDEPTAYLEAQPATTRLAEARAARTQAASNQSAVPGAVSRSTTQTTETQTTETQATETQVASTQTVETRSPETQSPKPQIAEPQVFAPLFAESQFAEPQAFAPQFSSQASLSSQASSLSSQASSLSSQASSLSSQASASQARTSQAGKAPFVEAQFAEAQPTEAAAKAYAAYPASMWIEPEEAAIAPKPTLTPVMNAAQIAQSVADSTAVLEVGGFRFSNIRIAQYRDDLVNAETRLWVAIADVTNLNAESVSPAKVATYTLVDAKGQAHPVASLFVQAQINEVNGEVAIAPGQTQANVNVGIFQVKQDATGLQLVIQQGEDTPVYATPVETVG